MLVVRNIQAELAALREKELELRAQHAEQLVRLLQETKADELDPVILAGALLAGLEEQDPARIEAWRRRGEAFFRPSRPSRRKAALQPAAAAEGTRPAAPPPAADQAA